MKVVPIKGKKQPRRQMQHSSLCFLMDVGKAPWNEYGQPEMKLKTHWSGLAEERIEINQHISQVQEGK
jgi:hypothetical protein